MKKLRVVCVLAVAVALGPAVMAQSPSIESGEKAKSDQVRAAVQQICPMSGNKLGEHGAPIKVKIGKEEVFLCCKGCLKSKVDAKHWATIHANYAKAQKECPVMKKALPKSPKWTIVEGRIVYVCCPPCIKKIEADPKTYLKMVDASYAAAAKKGVSNR